MSNPEDFGRTIAGSRWFKGPVTTLVRKKMIPVEVRWMCPMDGCDGEMEDNGMRWPMNIMGYHHTCTKCGFTAALSGKSYPTVEYEEAQ